MDTNTIIVVLILGLIIFSVIWGEVKRIDKRIDQLWKVIGFGWDVTGIIVNKGGINEILFGDEGLQERIEKLEDRIKNKDTIR